MHRIQRTIKLQRPLEDRRPAVISSAENASRNTVYRQDCARHVLSRRCWELTVHFGNQAMWTVIVFRCQ